MPILTPTGSSTPGRKTRLDLANYLPQVTEELVIYERDAKEIARLNAAEQENVQYIPEIGFRLESLSSRPDLIGSTVLGEASLLRASDCSLAANFEEKKFSRDPGLGGVTWDGPTEGMTAFHKSVASDDFDVKLDADEAAFPGPPGEYSADMDRVLVTTERDDPATGLSIQFFAPGSRVGRSRGLCRLYFSGPAGTMKGHNGLGQYCLDFRSDGVALLWEKGSTGTWKKMDSFVFVANSAGTQNTMFWAYIVSNSNETCAGQFIGDTIVIQTIQSPGKDSGDLLSSKASSKGPSELSKQSRVYKVPRLGDRSTAPSTCPIRVDVMRNIRPVIQISKDKFKHTGTVVDDEFSLPYYPTSTAPIYLEWYGTTPTGTTVVAKLLKTDGEELGSRTVTIPKDCTGEQISYAMPLFTRNFKVQFELTANPGAPGFPVDTRTPTILNYRIIRLPQTQLIATDLISHPILHDDKFDETVVQSVSINGAGENPATENGTVVVQDSFGKHQYLGTWAGKPASIVVEDEASGDDVTLIQGICDRSNAIHKGTEKFDGLVIGNERWYQYNLTIVGEAKRLMRRRCPARFNFQDKAAGKPYKVTDAVRILLNAAGYPDSMLDIPDLPIRLWVDQSGEKSSLVVDTDTPIYDILMQMVGETLGAYLVWDPSAGTYGKWRIIERKYPPYKPLMRFDMRQPVAGRMPHVLGAYGGRTDAGQYIPYLPVLKKTLSVTYEPPEANVVAVFGGIHAGAGQQTGLRYSQVLVNYASFNPNNLEPDDDGYPDPFAADYLGENVSVHRYDFLLTNQSAVDWVARRMFDYGCVGRKIRTFSSLLPFIRDEADVHQERLRIPRFYDPCEFVDERGDLHQAVILSCDPTWEGAGSDRFQMASYKIVTTTAMAKVAVPLGIRDTYMLGQRRLKRARQQNGIPSETPMIGSGNVEFIPMFNVMNGFPTAESEPIQVLDPNDANFGDFLFLPEYDPLG